MVGMSDNGTPTIQQFLEEAGIGFRPVDLSLPAAAVPAPEGWTVLGPEVLPGARQVLAAVDRSRDGWSPNAVLVDNTLVGSVDAAGFMECAVGDARRMPGWSEAIARVEPVAAGTRALIRGTYEADGRTVCVTTVYLLTEREAGQHLAQLTATIEAAAVDMLDGVDEMVAGLRVED
ncbi:hypothetical protein GCM10023353_03700 [Tomitella cavernea]|uniref:Lipoprotein LpqN n=2 Tax=Tomitella cavernea TaxID=1387982 RepID=A0ABP9C4C5_9ACTN